MVLNYIYNNTLVEDANKENNKEIAKVVSSLHAPHAPPSVPEPFDDLQNFEDLPFDKFFSNKNNYIYGADGTMRRDTFNTQKPPYFEIPTEYTMSSYTEVPKLPPFHK